MVSGRLQITIELRENTAAESSAYPYRQFMHFLNMHPTGLFVDVDFAPKIRYNMTKRL